MTYDQAQEKLEQHEIYVGKIISAGRGGDVCIGLHTYTPSILREKRMNAIREVLGDEFNVYHLSNSETIKIEKRGE